MSFGLRLRQQSSVPEQLLEIRERVHAVAVH